MVKVAALAYGFLKKCRINDRRIENKMLIYNQINEFGKNFLNINAIDESYYYCKTKPNERCRLYEIL